MSGQRWTVIALGLALGVLVPGAVEGQRVPAEDSRRAGAAWMGVYLGDATDGGVNVLAVVPGGPAERGGLRAGDVVIQAGGMRLLGVRDLTPLLEAARPGTHLEVRLLRAGETLQRRVDLVERPSSTAIVRTVVPRPPQAPLPPAAVPPPRAGCAAYGLSLADATPDLRRYLGAPDGAGVLVTGIAPGRPAAADGLRVGDILVQVGDRPVREVGDVERLLLAPGDGVVEVSLVRARREEVVTMSPRRPPAPSGSRRAAQARSAWIDAMRGVDAREERPDARVLSERVLRSEIERLQRRIDRLKRQLEARESDPD